MKIYSKVNISDLDKWKEAFIQKDSADHWKEGRSACSLAHYFTEPSIDNSKGIKQLRKLLGRVGYKQVDFLDAEIEHESRFDHYRGHGRMQDLFIQASANGKIIPICIEAKVDEAFGETIQKNYDDAETFVQQNPNSKKFERIQSLLKRYYNFSVKAENSSEQNEFFEMRYQLLHYLAGSIAEATNKVLLMPIFVFHTTLCNEKNATHNKEDYQQFMQSLDFKVQDKGNLQNCEIYLNEDIEGVKIWSFYVDITESESSSSK